MNFGISYSQPSRGQAILESPQSPQCFLRQLNVTDHMLFSSLVNNLSTFLSSVIDLHSKLKQIAVLDQAASLFSNDWVTPVLTADPDICYIKKMSSSFLKAKLTVYFLFLRFEITLTVSASGEQYSRPPYPSLKSYLKYIIFEKKRWQMQIRMQIRGNYCLILIE